MGQLETGSAHQHRTSTKTQTQTNERTNERTTMFSKTKTAAIACAALAFTAGCADASSSRGRLLQQVQPVQSVTALDTVEGLIPQRIKIDPYIDFMPLAELEAEAPAFENAPYPRTGVNFAAGPQGDAAPNSQVNEVDETPVVQDDARTPLTTPPISIRGTRRTPLAPPTPPRT